MASRVKLLFANKIIEALDGGRLTTKLLLPLIRVDVRAAAAAVKNNDGGGSGGGVLGLEISLGELHTLRKTDANQRSYRESLEQDGAALLQRLVGDEQVTEARLHPINGRDVVLKLSVPGAEVAREVVGAVGEAPDCFWKSSALLASVPHQKIVVEFSSPNIAKPFHVGHLRSTILGGFLARLHVVLGDSVTSINYLGDWGTQFGMLKYGYDGLGLSHESLAKDAIPQLYDAYVWANKKAEENPTVTERAKQTFARMEAGDQKELDTWRFFRDISIKDLQVMYARLGISFDEYHGESFYTAEKCRAVLQQMEEKNLLIHCDDGRKMFEFAPDRKVTVVKSDGSSIYLSRDIAAAVDRYNKYGFDRHYYVVDSSQIDHFLALFSALNSLGHRWVKGMRHVRFGRIRGLSTRRGNVVFLNDLLDLARQQMVKNQELRKTTKVYGAAEAEEAAEQVALSAMVVADLRQRRRRDYNFSWKEAMQSSGNTGVSFQYAHCRLMNLEEKCGVHVNPAADAGLLADNPVAMHLITVIARYDEALYDCYQELEPCILVNYLATLTRSISAAHKQLRVRGEPHAATAEARLLLFMTARRTLAAGIKLLGLSPLNKM